MPCSMSVRWFDDPYRKLCLSTAGNGELGREENELLSMAKLAESEAPASQSAPKNEDASMVEGMILATPGQEHASKAQPTRVDARESSKTTLDSSI